MSFIRTTTPAALLLTLLGLVTVVSPQTRGRRYRLEIHNHTSVNIERIYLSRSTEGKWGRDRLGSDVLEPRHFLPIDDLIAGEYDVMLVDEDERNCTTMDYPVFENKQLEIDDAWMKENCEGP